MGNSWRDDRQFEDSKIETVRIVGDGASKFYDLRFEGSLGFQGIEVDMGRKPEPGEILRQFGAGLGRPVRGCVLGPESDNPVVYYYRTSEEQEAEDQNWCAREEARKRAQFEKDKADLDRRVAALPPVLRARIELFRANCESFRWDFESYELFCCEEAIKIAAAVKTEANAFAFARADADTQKLAVEDLSPEHSRNTFETSVFLARCLLNPDKKLPYLAHGALTPLVGCKEYGCVHPRPKLERRRHDEE